MAEKRKNEVDLDISNKKQATTRYMGDHLREEVLLREPFGSVLVRFRMLDRSVRELLSSTDFIRRWFVSDATRFTPFGDAQMLVQRCRAGSSVHSNHFFNTLALTSAVEEAAFNFAPGNFQIVGGCRGVFCLADRNRDTQDGMSQIILWNPLTSESKFVPLSTIGEEDVLGLTETIERIGFGFDKRTNDFKVVRTLLCMGDLSEVYSWKMDSWRRLEDNQAHEMLNVVNSSLQSDDDEGKWFRWWSEDVDGALRLYSFDMSVEDFVTHDCGRLRAPQNFSIQSVSMVKGSLTVMFSDKAIDKVAPNELEIWMMLDISVQDEPWRRLFTIRTNRLMGCVKPVGIYKKGMFFVQRHADRRLLGVDAETEEIVPIEFQILGDWQSFQVFPYVPSNISLVELP